MLKYLKYEMKNSNKFISMLLIAVLVASIGIQNLAVSNLIGNSSTLMVIPIMVLMGAGLVYFIFTINLMKKDLYEDRGYLTFNLPLKGYEIIGAKILCTLIYSIVIFLVVFIVNFLVAKFITFPDQINKSLNLLSSEIAKIKSDGNFGLFISANIRLLLFSISSFFYSLALLFTSLIIGKCLIVKKKFSSLWFLIYVFNIYITTKLYEFISAIISTNSSTEFNGPNFGNFISYFDIGYFVIITLILIFISSYLLDKKVEI
ncbi:MAG: hypothetical protein ACTHWZ_02290 [Peptoniphilaceae bacterium]